MKRTMTLAYSPLDYMIRMYGNEMSSGSLKNLLAAMYSYHLAAKAYVNAH